MLNAFVHINWIGAVAALFAKPYACVLGYVGAMVLNVAINPNMPRPLLYALVNVPYFLLSSIAISVVLLLIHIRHIGNGLAPGNHFYRTPGLGMKTFTT